jgi:hypothetical protein
MAVSTLLQILQVSESQSMKATATNTALASLEAAMSDEYVLATAGTTTSYTLAFDTTNDLSSRLALRFVCLNIGSGATVPFNVIHPAAKHLFFVINNTSQDVTIKTPAGTGPTIHPAAQKLLYCDGVNIIDTTGAVGYNIKAVEAVGCMFMPNPKSSEVLARLMMLNAGTFDTNFALSKGSVITNPSATYAIDVRQNGSSIGNVSISSSGVFTFTNAGVVTVSAGDVITFVAPATADSAITGVGISLYYSYLVAQ